jgi:hypothetical protein
MDCAPTHHTDSEGPPLQKRTTTLMEAGGCGAASLEPAMTSDCLLCGGLALLRDAAADSAESEQAGA